MRSRSERFLPHLDEERLNHVVLLDGGRGGGKTGLFVTMLEWWSRRLLQAETSRREDPSASPEPEKLRALLHLTQDVVSVGMIDLQPLPPSINLLMHMVGQLQPLIEVLEEGDQDHATFQRARACPLD